MPIQIHPQILLPPLPRRRRHRSSTRNDAPPLLRKMGLSHQDIHDGRILMAQIPPISLSKTKVEAVLGYIESRLKREKALKTMGTSEIEVEMENTRRLGALGEVMVESRQKGGWLECSGGGFLCVRCPMGVAF